MSLTMKRSKYEAICYAENNFYIENNAEKHLPKDYETWAFFHPKWKQMNGFTTVNKEDVVKKLTDMIDRIQIEEIITIRRNTIDAKSGSITRSRPASICI